MLLVGILSVAGIRAIIAPTPRVSAPGTTPLLAQGETAFAQSFLAAYLTWSPGEETARDSALSHFMAAGLQGNGGLLPSGSQTVSWLLPVAEEPDGRSTRLVTIEAATSNGQEYLAVPIRRDAYRLLSVAGYPALVGPPATDTSNRPPTGRPVDDPQLQQVAASAVTAYLAGNRRALVSKLAADAVVSLPTQPLTVSATKPATWVMPRVLLNIDVTATDARGDAMTLSYVLRVVHHSRWRVQTIGTNPSYEGGNT